MITTTYFAFHETVEQYTDAVARAMPSASTVALLRPPDSTVATRWEQVLSEQYTFPGPPQPGKRVVVHPAGWAEYPARLLATLTGSRLVTVEDADGLAEAVAQTKEPSVVCVVPAAELTVARVIDLAAAIRSSDRPWGVVTGRTLPDLAFAVAKTVLRPRPDLAGTTVVDAPSHREAENAAPARRLTDPALFTLIRSHGEGGHAKLPGVVVCGLLDATEFHDEPSAGCSRVERRCKRASAPSKLLHASEVRAFAVAFVCCNGFNVARELYPSPVSVALGLTEGWVGALIAPIRPLVAPDSLIVHLSEMVHGGMPFGDVVRELNVLGDRLGQPDAFVLHGDPLARLEPQHCAPGAEGARPAMESPDPEWILRAMSQTDRGLRFLRVLRAWLGAEAPEGIYSMAQRLERASGLLLNLLKAAQGLPSTNSLATMSRTRFLATAAVGAWDREICAVLLEGREIFDAYDLGHYDQRLLKVEAGLPCPRCGTVTEISTFGGGERGTSDERRAEACVICGPLTESRRDGLQLTLLESTRSGRAGEPFLLRARLTMPTCGSVTNSVHLRLRFYDKATGVCAADEIRVLPARDQDVELKVALPTVLGQDLHSIRVVAVSGCDIAYARARFVGLP